MAFDPKQCRVLLVGKLMARLEPFLKGKGYPRVESEESGTKALTLLASASYHLVLLELNLRDIELRDFFLEARERQADASFILLASPTDAEMVVSALVLGADAYVPLPPDEDELFHVLERHGAAALTRKSANPDAQPGVSARVKQLEEELASARAQVADLEEQSALLDAEIARLNKLVEAAKSEAAERPAAPSVPPGHQVVATATLEELESRATFAEFLESENDEIKKERDALLERLRSLGAVDDGSEDGDGFDEPTGVIEVDDELRAHAAPRPSAPAPAAISPADVDDDEGDDDDGDELLIDDGDDEIGFLLDDDHDDGGDDGDDGEVAPAAAPAPAAPPSRPAAELAAPPPTVAEPAPAAAPERPAAPAGPRVIAPSPERAPLHAPPPTADDEPSGEDFDDFEDVNTDALLRLAGEVSADGPSADELEELLAAIDEE